MTDKNTLSILAEELGRLLEPLGEALDSPQNFSAFMQELGWNCQIIPSPLLALTSPLSAIIQNVEQVAANPSQIQDFIGLLKSFFGLVDGLKNQSPAAFPPTIDFNEFKNEFPQQLVQFLVVEYLENAHPQIGYFLKTIGVIRESQVSAAGLRLAYNHKEFAWNDLVQLFDDPLILVRNAYNWGQSQFDVERLTLNLAGLLSTFELEFQLQSPDPSLFNYLTQGNIGLQPHNNWILNIPFLQDQTSSFKTELGIGIYFFPETASDKPGFGLSPYARGDLSTEVELTENLTFFLEAAADLNGGVVIVVRPGQDVQVVFDIITSGGVGKSLPKEGRFALGIRNQKGGGEKILLLGSANSSRLEYSSASLKIGVQLDTNGNTGLYGEAELNELKMVIQPGSDADPFLSQLLPSDGFSADISLAVGLSSTQGFYFRGSGGLEIALPTHIQLGPIELQSALLAIKPGNSGIPIELGGTIKGDLGVLKAVVENIGLSANITFPPSGGNLGPMKLALGFKPPSGVGLSIDAGIVKGGGYLYFDFDREEYAGALELVFSEWIALKAIGLITTKMPDGSKGFSLLIIITVEFGTGIQLGFGFTLLGVGGLLGLHRVVSIEPVKEGIRTGAIESVMFPKDVIANAPKIISDLRKFFPPQLDIFLIGPMAKIGWGTPTLVSVSVGLILEFPSVNITLLGVIKVVLPDEKADVLRLQVNFVGRLEPSNKLLWFYAELYDSRVLFITLEGGFGLLVNWGDNANFVMSAGGFHPRYNPPPLPFPEPPRIAANLLNESYARIRVECYFAITSNSVQFGARAELYFGVSAFSIDGHLSFDALFQFNPFYFSFGLSVSLSVKLFGFGLFSIGFSGLLEGPTPWHIKGKGSISFFFFSISVPFEHTWGSSQDTKLEPIEVFPLLEAEFNALTNWEARLPNTSNLLVSLRKLGESASDQLVLHPVGKLRISQRKVPVNFKLEKVGNQLPADVNEIDVAAALPGSTATVTTLQEKFAIGLFKKLDSSKQLSSPAFEPLESGVEIGVAGEQLKASQAVRRVIRYETLIIDNKFKEQFQTFFAFFTTGFAFIQTFLFGHFLKNSAAKQSVLSQHYKKRLQPFDEVIQVQPSGYTIVTNTNNRPIDTVATTFTSQAQAQDQMELMISSDPDLAYRLQVIPSTEVNISV